MNPLGIFKAATEVVVSIGATAVVKNAIKVSTPADAKTLNRISIMVGGFVLSNMVGDMASKYAVKTIDDGINGIKEATENITIIVQNPEEEH